MFGNRVTLRMNDERASVWYFINTRDRMKLVQSSSEYSISATSLTIKRFEERHLGLYVALLPNGLHVWRVHGISKAGETRRVYGFAGQQVLLPMAGSDAKWWVIMDGAAVEITGQQGFRVTPDGLIISQLTGDLSGQYYGASEKVQSYNGITFTQSGMEVNRLTNDMYPITRDVSVISGSTVVLPARMRVAWYRDTAGLLVPVSPNSKFLVRETELEIVRAAESDSAAVYEVLNLVFNPHINRNLRNHSFQYILAGFTNFYYYFTTGSYIGQSPRGDWFLFVLTVLPQPTIYRTYWVLSGDSFGISFRQQISELKWFFIGQNSGESLQELVSNNRYTVSVMRTTDILAMEGDEIRITVTSRYSADQWYYRGSAGTTQPLVLSGVDVVNNGLIIRKLSYENEGTYHYVNANTGSTETFNIRRVVMPTVVETIQVLVGERVVLRNGAVSEWYKVERGILQNLKGSTGQYVLESVDMSHQGLYLGKNGDRWFAWQLSVSDKPAPFDPDSLLESSLLVYIPGGVDVALDVKRGVVRTWWRVPNTELTNNADYQLGANRLVIREFSTQKEAIYKAVTGGETVFFDLRLTTDVMRTTDILAMEGDEIRITITSRYSSDQWYYRGSAGTTQPLVLSGVDVVNNGLIIRKLSYENEGTYHYVNANTGSTETFNVRRVVMPTIIETIQGSTGQFVIESVSMSHQGLYLGKNGDRWFAWQLSVSDKPESSLLVYIPGGVDVALDVKRGVVRTWWRVPNTELTNNADYQLGANRLVIREFSTQKEAIYKAVTGGETVFFDLRLTTDVVLDTVFVISGRQLKIQSRLDSVERWYHLGQDGLYTLLPGQRATSYTVPSVDNYSQGRYYAVSSYGRIHITDVRVVYLERVENINALEGNYYTVDGSGSVTIYRVTVVEIPAGSNSVTITALLGSDVPLSPSVGTYQLVWYVAREGILYPPPDDVSYNSQQLVIPNIGYNHEAVYYVHFFSKLRTKYHFFSGSNGQTWFTWKVNVREEPASYEIHYIQLASNYVITVPGGGKVSWFRASPLTPISANNKDFRILENGKLFVIVNFRDELKGFYKYTDGRSGEKYVKIESLVGVVQEEDVWAIRGTTVTLQPGNAASTVQWTKRLQDQLTGLVRADDPNYDVTNGILTIRSLEISLEGSYLAVDNIGYGFKYNVRGIPDGMEVVRVTVLVGSTVTLTSPSQLYGSVNCDGMVIERAEKWHTGQYVVRDETRRWVSWNLEVIDEPVKYTTYLIEEGSKFALVTDTPVTWTYLGQTGTTLIGESPDYLLPDSQTLIIRAFSASHVGYYRATFDTTNSHTVYNLRLCPHVSEERVVYALYGARVELKQPDTVPIAGQWYLVRDGVVRAGPVGQSYVIEELSTVNEGTCTALIDIT
eukprot:sb/3460985/